MAKNESRGPGGPRLLRLWRRACELESEPALRGDLLKDYPGDRLRGGFGSRFYGTSTRTMVGFGMPLAPV